MNDDTISRRAAIDAVKKNTFRLTFAEEQNCEGHVAWSANAVYSDVIEGALLELPSAQPDVPGTNVGDMVNRAAAIDILDAYQVMVENGEENPYAWARLRMSELPSAQPEQQNGRIFQGIVVEYLSYNTYPEYKGKPYFSIKYTENGQGFIGYGTYKPEVLSEYLKEYFMPSAQPERKKGKWGFTDGFGNMCECSECGARIDIQEKFRSFFCYHCGADMREDVLQSAQPVLTCKGSEWEGRDE